MGDLTRVARGDDAEAILAIYAPIVRETAISFELEPPSVEEMRGRIEKTLEGYPWLVMESDGEVVGYAYGSQHRVRAAYQWSVDVSAYVAPSAQRRGIGRRLYSALLSVLRQQGYYTAFAGITVPNDASQGLHEAMGFRKAGVYENSGYKLGAWHGTVWLMMALREYGAEPSAPRRFAELNAEELQESGVASV
jgi:L-amino acid N-acyltransferase YncA